MSTIVSFEIGYLIGIILFLICERKGLIHKWSGSLNIHPRKYMGLHLSIDGKRNG